MKRFLVLVLVVFGLGLVPAAAAAGPEEGPLSLPPASKFDLNFDGMVDGNDVAIVEAVFNTRLFVPENGYSGVRTPEITGLESQDFPYRVVNSSDFLKYRNSFRRQEYREELDWYPDGILDGQYRGPDLTVLGVAYFRQDPDVSGDGWVTLEDVNLIRQAAGFSLLPSPASHFWVVWDVEGEARLGYFGGDCVFNAVSGPVKFAPTADRPDLFGVDFIVADTRGLAVAVYAYGVPYPLGYSRSPGEWPH